MFVKKPPRQEGASLFSHGLFQEQSVGFGAAVIAPWGARRPLVEERIHW